MVASEQSVPAGVQHGTVMVETGVVVGLETDVVVAADVHTGTGPEIIWVLGGEWGTEAEAEAAVGCVETGTVAVGVSAKTVMSAGLGVGQMEGKTGPCAAFNVDVVGQDMNTTQGVLSNLGVGIGVHLTPQVGVHV